MKTDQQVPIVEHVTGDLIWTGDKVRFRKRKKGKLKLVYSCKPKQKQNED